jgi:hypothetical protein
VVLEIVKIVVSILFGGLAGSLLNDWRRRRDSRVQPIPLIERVNRLISPELEGVTLARVVGDANHRKLEELKNLREYQLTLRNTSTVHLQDAEILFEFPAKDVQAWVSRPALSKTPLLNIDANPTDPWKKAFRWRIPHFPSGDSVEFTFRAVDPSSELYEVALFKGDRIIVERVVGEPAPKGKLGDRKIILALAVLIGCTPLIAWIFGVRLILPSDEKFTAVKLGGCDLNVVSVYDRYGQNFNSPWRVKDRVFNLGPASCIVQSEQLDPKGPFTIAPGANLDREFLTEHAPELAEQEIIVGTTNTAPQKSRVQFYTEK